MNEISDNGKLTVEKEDPEDSPYDRFKLKSVEEIESLTVNEFEDLKKYAKSLTEEQLSLKDLNKELKDISVHDTLTHLFNREGINQEIERLMKKGIAISILDIDLGNFKEINDTYGHPKGDEILITFAQKCIQESIKRSGDTSGRYERGDEFIVILPNTGIKGAVKVEDRIQRTLKGVKMKNPEDPALNKLIADIGIANWDPKSGDTMEKFIKKADGSMYKNKRARKEGIKVGS